MVLRQRWFRESLILRRHEDINSGTELNRCDVCALGQMRHCRSSPSTNLVLVFATLSLSPFGVFTTCVHTEYSVRGTTEPEGESLYYLKSRFGLTPNVSREYNSLYCETYRWFHVIGPSDLRDTASLHTLDSYFNRRAICLCRPSHDRGTRSRIIIARIRCDGHVKCAARFVCVRPS